MATATVGPAVLPQAVSQLWKLFTVQQGICWYTEKLGYETCSFFFLLCWNIFFFPFFKIHCLLTSLYQHSQAVECFSCTFPMQVEHDSSFQTRVYSLWYQEMTNSTPSDTHIVKTCARSSLNVLVRCSQVHPTTALQQVPSSRWEV